MNTDDIYFVNFYHMSSYDDEIHDDLVWAGESIDSARSFVREFGLPVKQIDKVHLAPWCEDAYEVDGTDLWFGIEKFDPANGIRLVKEELKEEGIKA